MKLINREIEVFQTLKSCGT